MKNDTNTNQRQLILKTVKQKSKIVNNKNIEPQSKTVSNKNKKTAIKEIQ